MLHLKKLTMTLALAFTGALASWAQDEYVTVTKNGDANEWTFEMPDADVELEIEYYTDAELDQMAADEVIAKITAIGTVTYTPESKALIDAARTAYDTLTADQQALVTNISTLTDAETTYATAEETAYTEGVELTMNSDGTWTITSMPAFDVELEVEYDDGSTAVISIKDGKVDNVTYYDLSGRKVAKPTKGLFIVNGKKVVIK